MLRGSRKQTLLNVSWLQRASVASDSGERGDYVIVLPPPARDAAAESSGVGGLINPKVGH